MTGLQTDRRRDPYPFTWEPPLGALASTLTLAGFGVQLGRAAAHWHAGAGWAWPQGRTVLTSIPAVLTGHPTAGLDPAPAIPASSAAVTGWIIATEAVLALLLFAAAILVLRRWGPARLKGMATPAEAEAALGLSRLRKQRHIVRPDLYPTRSHRRNQ
jgi:hypothetical protein